MRIFLVVSHSPPQSLLPHPSAHGVTLRLHYLVDLMSFRSMLAYSLVTFSVLVLR